MGSDGYKGQQKKNDGADGVVEWLGWRMDGVDKIEEPEAGLLVEEQSCRMKDSNC